MKNAVQDGKVLNVTVGADVVSGQAAKVGSAFGVYVNTGKSGEVVPMVVEGVIELPKDASVIAGFGTLVYWDDTAKKVTITASTNIKIGYAIAAQLTGDATVKVKLVPSI